MEANKLTKANEELIQEYLDIVEHDSENLERTMRLFSDDCIWEMEPTGQNPSNPITNDESLIPTLEQKSRSHLEVDHAK